jgi:hypothetical protein
VSLFSKGSNDSYRFALLLSRLYSDAQVKSVWGSLINLLTLNRQVGARLPKFKDTRKNKGQPVFTGWTSEEEHRSPLSELFSTVVPAMQTLQRKRGAIRFPPPPPYPELAPPAETCSVPSIEMEIYRPVLSDLAQDERKLVAISPDQIHRLARNVQYTMISDSLKTEPVLEIEDDEHFEK